MKHNESSMTSLVSSFGRAYHSKYDTPNIFDDFIAKELISDEEFSSISRNMIDGIQFFNKEIAQKWSDNPEEILKWIVQVQLSPTPLARAAYCEKVLFNEIKLGVKQYVILGAGLDTFALRYPELEDNIEIFEIDHPATQEFKKNRLNSKELYAPGNIHFIPMDFTKDFSYQELINQGFQHEKTFISLLGVSYYLTKKENEDLIKQLFANLPEGSSIVFDYADDQLFEEKGLSNRVENMVKMAAAGGEPMKSSFNRLEMDKMLERAGLLVYEHLSPAKIQEQFFSNRDDYLKAFETIHYIHAVKK
ncbi:methyltransferase, TIGR00027 family [Gracilibacillus ureilyticus]|uniref:S-adenosyl-L-methionine-dependent methyltransferase n=1 Tax=Gracilibacillus ureilyticus TaxID=531814 RepID=A0A1H9W283_9BACI|nr:class I SAM-dependent methyltransferase [Gracilibacillus ureilyticus]SES27623.1 methyltransferase, TIGR00027 family [Gracilibacillus ureilyticus]